jgi:glycosyltransferase involved in cell wall biosynthesis
MGSAFTGYADHVDRMVFPFPRISDTGLSGARPFWSVMIPTYKARSDYLKETLKSVLQQDPGPAQMQIELVDDCSPNGAPVQLVRDIAGDRVTVHREPKNNGLAGIWNRCIERARGEWVHILHHDDVVLPGFYERLYDGIVCNPDVGMAFSRFAVIDADGHWIGLGPLERTTAGVLNNWLERIATGYHLECPAVVVKRATYERLGGFATELVCFLDVEMWVRIAANALVYYEPQILAGFRRHGKNVHAFQERTGENLQDMAKAISIWKNYLPVNSREQLEHRGRTYWALASLMLTQRFFSEGDIVACTNNLRAAKMLWNHGGPRWRRLTLQAKVLLYHVFGRRAISAMRALRRRMLPRYQWLQNENGS